MRNNKPIPKSELKQGMRVKIPWNGQWFGSNKKYVWLKGTIIEVNDNSVVISLRKCRGVNRRGINRCMCLGDNLNYIYKQL